LAARLEAATSPKAAELSLGMDGSETRPYTTIRDPSLHGQARGRGERPYVDRSAATSGNRAEPFAIFKVVFVGHIQSFGFILSVYDAQAS